jgi:hypothetical protein
MLYTIGTITIQACTTASSNRYTCTLQGLASTEAAPVLYNTVAPVAGSRYYIHSDFSSTVCTGAIFTYSYVIVTTPPAAEVYT